jgi:serine/threonine protein kinase/Tol biopolymer transport system component
VEHDERWLTDLVDAVLDGTASDLDTAEVGASDSQRAAIRQLRILARVSELNRSLPIDPSSTEAVPGDSSGRLVSWGRLSILAEIGRGAYGEVYRARDPRLDREVALKLLRLASTGDSERQAAHLVEEGRLLARVKHPNVVSIYDADWIADRVGLTMEFVDGRTLEQCVEADGPFSSADTIRIGIEVCRALSAVHRAGLLHRDIKAQNVMRQIDGRLVLMDFGAGRELDSLVATTQAGTPLYLAPEILDGKPASVQSDIYSVGVLLYHLLTADYPIAGRSLRELADRHRRGERTPLAIRRPGVDQALAPMIERATSPTPSDRYATADDFLAALERLSHKPAAGVRPWMFVAAAVLAVIVVTVSTLSIINLGSSRRSGVAASRASLGLPDDRSVAIHRIEPPERLLLFGQLSYDGRYIPYSEFDDGGLMVLDVMTGKTRRIADNDSGDSSIVESAVMAPDGAKVAYSWESGECRCIELRVADTRNSGSTPETVLHDQSVADIRPVDWLPDGTGVLARLRKKDGTRTIALISTLDGATRVLKDGLEYDLSMHLSPDGRFVAYDYPVRTDDGARDILVMPVDGAHEGVVVGGAAQDAYPVWTPNGRGILFVSDRSGSLGLWMVRVAEGQALGVPELVMKDVGRMVPESLSHTGRLLYRLQSRPVDSYTARLDSSGLVAANTVAQAAASYLGSNLDPEWSPDGMSLALVSRRRTIGPRAQALVIRSLAGGRERELWPDLENLIEPRWSPDGRSFLVRGTDRFGVQHVYQLNATSGAIMGTFDPSVSNEWAANGRSFYSVANRRIWETEIPSGIRREIYRDPGKAGIVALAVSPSDGWLAIAVNTQGGRKIQIIPADGGQARDVFEASGADRIMLQQWTRLGDAILFTRATIGRSTVIEGPWQLWSVPATGDAPRSLQLEMDRLRGVRVSPDGAHIAFRTGDPVWDSWLMDNFLPRP